MRTTTIMANQILANLREEITQVWFAATREQNERVKATLLAKYRELRRRYELEQLLGKADLA